MKILSIETSCDETAISIVEAHGSQQNARFKILANQLVSQVKLHARYGGVYPMLAKREHIKNLPLLLKKVLTKAGLNEKKPKIDLIAVTHGPGLEPALWTGITFAQELACKWKIPLVPVNHMEGHFFSAMIKRSQTSKNPRSLTSRNFKFPILALLVSGGHTELVLSKKFLRYKIIGRTLDDAVGEAFDKVARMLGLPYPGGPEISKLAEEGRKSLAPLLNKEGVGGGNSKNYHPASGTPPRRGGDKIVLPRPMLKSPNFDFSFSGLKTAVLYLVRDLGRLTPALKTEIAREFENAVVEVLVTKTIAATRKHGVKTILVGGGVASNKHLQEEMSINAKKLNLSLCFPHPEMFTDNSLMIALAGYFHRNDKKPAINKIRAHGNLHF